MRQLPIAMQMKRVTENSENNTENTENTENIANCVFVRAIMQILAQNINRPTKQQNPCNLKAKYLCDYFGNAERITCSYLAKLSP